MKGTRKGTDFNPSPDASPPFLIPVYAPRLGDGLQVRPLFPSVIPANAGIQPYTVSPPVTAGDEAGNTPRAKPTHSNYLPLPRCRYRQQAVMHLEFVIDILQVEPDRIFRDTDISGDQLVG